MNSHYLLSGFPEPGTVLEILPISFLIINTIHKDYTVLFVHLVKLRLRIVKSLLNTLGWYQDLSLDPSEVKFMFLKCLYFV